MNLKNDQFRDVATKVVKDVVTMAPVHGGYAEGRRKTYGLSVYGMAICWNTLDEKACSDCLTNASTAVLDCLPSIEARSLSVGCYFRYSEFDLPMVRISLILKELFSCTLYLFLLLLVYA